MTPLTISFIGTGNMAQCMMQGFYQLKHHTLQAYSPNAISKQKALPFVKMYSSLEADCLNVDVLILAVKPHQIVQVCQQLNNLPSKTTVVSVAAGISLTTLATHLPKSQPIVRTMPNIPCSIRQGMTTMIKNEQVDAATKSNLNTLFQSIGKTLWINTEEKMHAVTALSGSGPAFFLTVFNAFIEAGMQLGLSQHEVSELVLETSLGSAELAKLNVPNLPELIQSVISKGGTTEAGMTVLNEHNIATHLKLAIIKAHQRSIDLASEKTS